MIVKSNRTNVYVTETFELEYFTTNSLVGDEFILLSKNVALFETLNARTTASGVQFVMEFNCCVSNSCCGIL